jgi:hypothetical protein
MDGLIVVWIDSLGQTRMTTYLAQTGQGEALKTAMRSVSNAAVLWWGAGDLIQQEPVMASGVFQPVDDAARLDFRTASGRTVSLIIPAPNESIFTADGLTVEPAEISGLIDEFIAQGIAEGGDPVVSFIRGYRRQRKTRS